MTYDIYKQARNTAWKFLIDNEVNALPVKLSAICRRNDIALLYDDGKYLSDNKRGITFIDDNRKFNIVLNSNYSDAVKRYTIGHELGHIFLGHFTEDTMNNADMEYQAERFAIDILAPACVLWGLDLHKAEDIAKICNISMQSARIRAERMDILYKRNKFLTSPLEKQVFENFSDFIRQHKSK